MNVGSERHQGAISSKKSIQYHPMKPAGNPRWTLHDAAEAIPEHRPTVWTDSWWLVVDRQVASAYGSHKIWYNMMIYTSKMVMFQFFGGGS